MTIQEWLDARRPAPPAALAQRVAEFMQARGAPDDSPAAACLHAAETGLRRLVRDGDGSRASALDLLAIEALITYAFEAAADDPPSIQATAQDAMARLSLVARL